MSKIPIIISLQGAATWELDGSYESDWDTIGIKLREIKPHLNPRVFFSSRKLLEALEKGGLLAPTEIRLIDREQLQIVWMYKSVYSELTLIYGKVYANDKRIVRHGSPVTRIHPID